MVSVEKAERIKTNLHDNLCRSPFRDLVIIRDLQYRYVSHKFSGT